MTAEGASRRTGHLAARPWDAVRRLSSRTSLRTKLITALVGLVILALGALGMIGISILRGYLLGPFDNELQGAGGSPQVLSCVEGYLSGGLDCHANNIDIYWLPSSGQLEPVLTQQPNTYLGYLPTTNPAWLPDVSGAQHWLTANPQQATTVPAQSGGEKWRVMGFNATVTNLQTGAQSAGTIIVATDVTTVYGTLQKLIWVDTIVSAAIICVLAGVGYAVVRSNLRPLVENTPCVLHRRCSHTIVARGYAYCTTSVSGVS